MSRRHKAERREVNPDPKGASGDIRAQVDIASATATKARIDLDRRAGIAGTGAVSGEELTLVRNAYATAQGNLVQARAGLSQAVAARSSGALMIM